MRTIIELPDEQVRTLDMLGKKYALSRAELVRRAVDAYLMMETERTTEEVDKYFGLFKDDPVVFEGLDAHAYQREVRAEWDARDAAIEQRLQDRMSIHDSVRQDYEK